MFLIQHKCKLSYFKQIEEKLGNIKYELFYQNEVIVSGLLFSMSKQKTYQNRFWIRSR